MRTDTDIEGTAKTSPGERQDGESGDLPVGGPTIKQELFLRRQKLWSEDLTRQDAGWLIQERLKELSARAPVK